MASAAVRLTTTESKLFVREWPNLLFVVGLPLALVLGFGAISGNDGPTKDLGNQRVVDYITVMSVAIAIAILSLQIFPAVMCGHRGRGILRRLSTTPARPGALLGAQLIVTIGMALVSTGLVMLLGALAFDVAAPRALGWFLLVFGLSLAALFGLGMVIAALAPTEKAGNGIGMMLFFPSLFLAGVYMPYDGMPSGLQNVCDLTPLGAALQGMRETWVLGDSPRPQYLIVLAVWAVLSTAVATKTFRWE
jgi:ABC-2 type transport system permease protein